MLINRDPVAPLPAPDAEGNIRLGMAPMSLGTVAIFVVVIPLVIGFLLFAAVKETSELMNVCFSILSFVLVSFCLLGLLVCWRYNIRPGYIVIGPTGLSRGIGTKLRDFTPWSDVRKIRIRSLSVERRQKNETFLRTMVSVQGQKELTVPYYGVAPDALASALREAQARACPGMEAAFVDERIQPDVQVVSRFKR